jgi:cysteine desulfurase/selenocysteine lyase
MSIDWKKIRADFPMLQSELVYLDSASTSLTPQPVLDAMNEYYTQYGANVHRGIYAASEKASAKYEHTRELTRAFIGARDSDEIIFNSGTTAGMNTIAALVGQDLTEGDEIILTRLEHHANLVPWQLLARAKGVVLKFLETTPDDELDIEELKRTITQRTKVLSLTHISNTSGYITPVKEFAEVAKKSGIFVIVDGAQSVPHMPVNVQELGIDALTFSAHKMLGPTGVGVLWAKREHLERWEPVWGGGSMISEVGLQSSTWADLPLKFEPGTPNIAGVIGLGAAIDYLQRIGMETIRADDKSLDAYLQDSLAAIPGLTILGPNDFEKHSSIISFTIDGIHPHDIASLLDQQYIAVRAGHHCAQPLLQKWGVPATTRISTYFYNTREEIAYISEALLHVTNIFNNAGNTVDLKSARDAITKYR